MIVIYRNGDIARLKIDSTINMLTFIPSLVRLLAEEPNPIAYGIDYEFAWDES